MRKNVIILSKKTQNNLPTNLSSKELMTREKFQKKVIEFLENVSKWDYKQKKDPFSNWFKETYKEEPFLETELKNLDYKTSDTFLSERFMQILRKTKEVYIDEVKEGRNKRKALNKLNNKLQSLSSTEYEWKQYHNRISYETENQNIKYFQKQYLNFEKEFNRYIGEKIENIENTEPEEAAKILNKRSQHNSYSYKARSTLKMIMQKMSKEKEFRSFKDLVLTESFLDKIVRNISSKYIFDQIVKIVVKTSHENLFNDWKMQGKKYSDLTLVIKQTQLFYELSKLILSHLISTLLNSEYVQKVLSEKYIEELYPSVGHYILYSEAKYANSGDTNWRHHAQNSMVILQIFVRSEFFEQRLNEEEPRSNKKNVLYTLPKSINIDQVNIFKFPQIVAPKKLKMINIDRMIKPLVFGEGHLSKTKKLLDSLNISQMYKQWISNQFLDICKEFFTNGYPHFSKLESMSIDLGLDLGYPSAKDIIDASTDWSNMENNLSYDHLSIDIYEQYKKYHLAYSKKTLTQKSNILFLCGLNATQRTMFHLSEHSRQMYVEKLIDRKMLNTKLFLAEILLDLPIYITDTMCIRMRMYPKEHWISRTSGSVKHLLCSYTEQKLTLNGLINMIEAYYAPDSVLLNKFRHFLSGNKIESRTGKRKLISYFKENYLAYSSIEKPLYFMHLHAEILRIERLWVMKTSVNLEIDQSASALTFLALILRDKRMAEVCSLTSTTDSDPYIYIMDCFKNFSESFNKFEFRKNTDVYEFLSIDRKLHKYAIMCYCYNQGFFGRSEDFTKRWFDVKGYNPTSEEVEYLNAFAKHYDDFVNFVFPKVTQKLDLFQKLVDTVSSQSTHLKFKTLDGDIISWAFYKTKSVKASYFDHVNKSHIPFSLWEIRMTKSVHDKCSIPLKDSAAMKVKFLSYLIHSMDACILKQIIRWMKRNTGSPISHLHDCVIIHPNYLDEFYNIVFEIYSSKKLYNSANDLVFNVVKSSVNDDTKAKVEEIQQEFLELCDDFYSDLENINPRMLYKPEG